MYEFVEIFESLQGEGRNTGRPCVFLRFAGCNLKCPWCDTDTAARFRLSLEETLAEVGQYRARSVILTGGEPTLQLHEDEPMFDGRFIAMETNGIEPAPRWVKWVTISPKTKLTLSQLDRASEIKVLLNWFKPREMARLLDYCEKSATPLYIQPIADEKGKFDVAPVVAFVKEHPLCTVSLQWHKLFAIP